MSQCIVEGCENKAAKNSETGLCTTCYNGLYYWLHKTPGQVMARMKQLYKLKNRMELLTSNRKLRG